LIKHLSSSPVLIFPAFDKQFFLPTDASWQAIGGVVSQMHNGAEHPVAYWSRQLQKSECNYPAIEREALAVVSAVNISIPICMAMTLHSLQTITHSPP
jgi:hypothetical protein